MEDAHYGRAYKHCNAIVAVDASHGRYWPTFLLDVLATKPALIGATVREAPHCTKRKQPLR